MARAFLEVAERVHEARADKIAEARALLIGEAGVAHVLLRPRQIDFLVGDVEIAAEEHGLFLLQLLRVGEQRAVPLLPEADAHKLGLRVGHVDADDVAVVELRGDRAALGVVRHRSEAERDGHGFLFREERGAAVAFFLRGVPDHLVALGPRDALHVAGQRLHFLEANHVGFRRGHPVEQALAERGAHAVDVPREEFHARPLNARTPLGAN